MLYAVALVHSVSLLYLLALARHHSLAMSVFIPHLPPKGRVRGLVRDPLGTLRMSSTVHISFTLEQALKNSSCLIWPPLRTCLPDNPILEHIFKPYKRQGWVRARIVTGRPQRPCASFASRPVASVYISRSIGILRTSGSHFEGSHAVKLHNCSQYSETRCFVARCQLSRGLLYLGPRRTWRAG